MIEFIVFAAVLALIAVGMFTLPPPWLRDALSRNWPTAEGTIEGGEVYVVGAQNKMFRTKLKYIYRVNDRL